MTRRKSKPPAETSAAETAQPPVTAAKELGRYAYEGLDRTIHEKARLGILTSLAAHPGGLLFNDLKDVCSLSDGNLSRHLQTLLDAGLVETWKRIQRNRPQTLCRLTDLGRQRLLAYIAELERVVADAALASQRQVPSPRQAVSGLVPPRALPGWVSG